MLNQAILLNMNIGKKEMGTAIGLYILLAVWYIFFNNTLYFTAPLFLIGFVACSVYEIKAINKVFYTSFFDDEGALYMALPLSAKDMVMGKSIIISTFLWIGSWLVYLGMFLAVVFAGTNLSAIIENLSLFMPTLGQSSLETAITFALFPLYSFIECFFHSILLLTIFITLGLKKWKLFFCWLGAIALFLPIGLCVEFFNKQLEAVAYGSAIVEVITGAVYLIVSYYAVKKCVQALEERYDV